MRTNHGWKMVAAAAVLLCAGSMAIAQPPKHGMATSHMGGGFHLFGKGKIIGNKNTHVYHLPGDKGNLPEMKNRVYFRTEAEARRAGYHLAGKPHGKMILHSKMPMGHMNGHKM